MSLTDEHADQYSHLAVVKALEIELTDGADAALKFLGPPIDPIRMRGTLGILIRADQFDVAVDLVRDQRIDEKWVDLAAFMFSRVGDIATAATYVAFADDCPDPVLMRRTRVAFAEGVVQRWQSRYAKESLLSARQWSEADVALAKTVAQTLDPALASIRARRAISGEVELGAAIYSVHCARIADDPSAIGQYAEWLINYRPIPFIVAELCLRSLIDCPVGLPNRLRIEHSGNFDAAHLAALIERDLLRKPIDAFDALVRLASEGTTDEQKESACIVLFETCGLCDSARVDQAIEMVQLLRPNDSRLLGLLRTTQHALAGRLAEARAQLDSVRDETDGVWWQAHAQLCEREGSEEAAQKAWEKASELLPHPDVIRRSVQASLDRRRYESAVRGLESLLSTSPDSQKELNVVAFALIQLGNYAQASKYLQRLVDLDPSSADHRVALAQCLARTARVAEAIAILQPVCDGNDPPISAVLLQSELLQSHDEASKAFDILAAIAGNHWDDPQFLLRYMHCGHAAGEDRRAHEALVRLIGLRQAGRVPDELMQTGTLEDLLEYGKEFQQRRESLQTEVVSGRMPWLFVEDILGNPPIWAWTIHSQELPWISEEPLAAAALTVYSTNGFTVCSTNGAQELTAISASPKGTDIIADLSAIITLHHLGQLDKVAEYFGRLLLPASYGDLRVRDADRFGQHQPSREMELKAIRDAIDCGRIRIVDNDGATMALVDEYSDGSASGEYRLRDLIAPLRAGQKVRAEAIDELLEIAHKPSTVADGGHPHLEIGSRLLVELSTLRALANRAAFQSILDSFNVHLCTRDRDELVAGLRAYEVSKRARLSHDALWDSVARLEDTGRISWQPVARTEPSSNNEVDIDSLPSIYLDSIKLAQHTGKSIIVDDRVLQIAMYQKDSRGNSRAFGTDCVLSSMLDSETSSIEEIAVAFRALMSWRYRFLIPSSRLLFHWAEENLDNLPGDSLLDAAVYVHACMRDPGLHCGFEQSAPPMPMAAKLVAAWTHSIAEFVAAAWTDVRFSDDAASALTRWVAEELIPSCPRGLWRHRIGHNIARAEMESTVTMTLVQLTTIHKMERANRGLRVLSEALGLDDERFMMVAAEAIHALDR